MINPEQPKLYIGDGKILDEGAGPFQVPPAIPMPKANRLILVELLLSDYVGRPASVPERDERCLTRRYNWRMIELAKTHRTIRSYTAQDINDSFLDDLLLAGLRSSSAGTMQTWSVVVTGGETNERWLYETH